MLTQNQQTVYNWINDDLERPVYAEAYKGALEQLNEESPGYITFVSHAGRDLMNGLAPSVNRITRERVQYEQLVDDFKDDWKDEWGGEDSTLIEGDDEITHPIPNEICQKVKKLVDEHKAGRLRAEEKGSFFFTTFLDYPNKESIPENLYQEWRRARRWFIEHAHLREGEFSIETSNEAAMYFRYLDSLLYTAASSELDLLRSIHEVLEGTNQ